VQTLDSWLWSSIFRGRMSGNHDIPASTDRHPNTKLSSLATSPIDPLYCDYSYTIVLELQYQRVGPASSASWCTEDDLWPQHPQGAQAVPH
jgi:hypothetical protein